MPENAEEKNIAEEEIEEKKTESENRSYYYDDACGYETYQPDEETEDDT